MMMTEKKSKFNEKFGPWALITGASDGIGRSLALELAKEGIHLILVARNKEKLTQLSEEIKNFYSVKIEIISLDLSMIESTEKLIHLTKNFDIGLLGAIAGFGTSGLFIHSKIEEELNMLDLNCKAVIAQCFHFGKIFSEKKRGGIILMSSLVAFQGVPYAAHYSATKAFIQNFSEGLYYELKPWGVSVLSVAPGPVKTGFADRAHMKMTLTDSPDKVAYSILKALGKCITVRPGCVSKFLGWSLNMMNRWGRIQVMKKSMYQMIDHKITSIILCLLFFK